jgi:acetoacetyl-CoA synthetase
MGHSAVYCSTRVWGTQINRELLAKASRRHVPTVIIEAPDLPHTRSRKLVELAVRAVRRGRPVKNTGAWANPESLDFFREHPELSTPRMK